MAPSKDTQWAFDMGGWGGFGHVGRGWVGWRWKDVRGGLLMCVPMEKAMFLREGRDFVNGPKPEKGAGGLFFDKTRPRKCLKTQTPR